MDLYHQASFFLKTPDDDNKQKCHNDNIDEGPYYPL